MLLRGRAGHEENATKKFEKQDTLDKAKLNGISQVKAEDARWDARSVAQRAPPDVLKLTGDSEVRVLSKRICQQQEHHLAACV